MCDRGFINWCLYVTVGQRVMGLDDITAKIRLSCKTSLLPPSLHVVPSYSPRLVLPNIKLTDQLISCAGMIDTSYLRGACLSSAGARPSLFLRADGTHDGFRHPSEIVIWHEGIIKGRSFTCNYGRK